MKKYEDYTNFEKFMVYFKYFGVLTINLCLVWLSIHFKIYFLTVLFLFTTFMFAFPSLINKWCSNYIQKHL